MKLKINGFRADGVLVIPKSARYELEIDAKGKLDLFTFETCHREEISENAGEGGLFGNRKHVERSFIPNSPLETEGACPVRLGGYERDKGRHSWAFVDFEDLTATLPAELKCNGNTTNTRGVSACQSRSGLIQQITFPVKTIVNPETGCSMPRPSDLMTYRFNMSPKECVYNFMEQGAPNREHRLTTLGYDGILIREQ